MTRDMPSTHTGPGANVGVVVIGRNEGERLRLCLKSLQHPYCPIVYVDSGSTDGSMHLAQSLGASCVALDNEIPFTAARARNAGLRRLLGDTPSLDYVQFVDGDCEVAPDWISTAANFLATHPGHAVVFGRRRERHPEASVYNRLCDLEWSGQAGDSRSCGGDAMFRADPLNTVGGYREDLIAGEEPELCIRLRALGWKVHRLDFPMTIHDACILRFGQWWRRIRRSGYAFAQGAWLHGAAPEHHWVRETIRALAYGLALPFAISAATALWDPRALVLLAIYPAQVGRIALRDRTDIVHAGLLVLGRFPEAIGALQFIADQLRRRHRLLIEYK